MKWLPLGEPEERPMENEMLWTFLALQGQETEGQTMVHCRYVSQDRYKNGGWVNIYKSTFLVNPDTRDMLAMTQAFHIPISPARHFFQEPGQLKQFTLLFPPVPRHWRLFHLLEFAESGGGFRVCDIKRNDSGVYHVQLS